jgi:hypothetical protein
VVGGRGAPKKSVMAGCGVGQRRRFDESVYLRGDSRDAGREQRSWQSESRERRRGTSLRQGIGSFVARDVGVPRDPGEGEDTAMPAVEEVGGQFVGMEQELLA